MLYRVWIYPQYERERRGEKRKRPLLSLSGCCGKIRAILWNTQNSLPIAFFASQLLLRGTCICATAQGGEAIRRGVLYA